MNADGSGVASSDTSDSSLGLQSPPSGVTRLRLPAVVLVLTLLGLGAVFVAALHTIFPVFRPADELLEPFPPPELAVAREESLQKCRLLNTAVAMGLFALVAGTLVGIGEASMRDFGRGSATRLVPAVILCVLLAGTGVVLAHLVAELSSAPRSSWALAKVFLSQAILLAGCGAGVGAAVGLVAGGRSTMLSSAGYGVLAGGLAALVYVLAASAVLPRSQTGHLIPGGVLWGGKDLPILAVWAGIFVGLLGLTLALGNRRSFKNATASAPLAAEATGETPPEEPAPAKSAEAPSKAADH